MPVTGWIQALEAGGRLKVPVGSPAPAAWAAPLAALAERAAWELPGPAPAFSAAAAGWAAARVLAAAQAIAYRDRPPEAVTAGFEPPCPAPLDAGVAWSVDLTLRQLPRLIALARGVAPEDPLMLGLHGLARDWPLSSVGVHLDAIDAARLAPVLEHPGLRRCYVDRVLARAARDRLQTPAVAAAACAALGDQLELCPALVGALGPQDPAPEAADADRP